MMRKVIITALTAALILTGCQSAREEKTDMPTDAVSTNAIRVEEAGGDGQYHAISAAKAKKMMEEQNVVVVDVRTADEYAQGHVQSAILLPNESIGSEMPMELPDKDATILVYCRSGRRSKEAAGKLLDLGYRNVYDFGGINDWPYDVVTEE